ncbi:UNVERIFIED_CONTAM: hypothetical protein Sradi_7103600 [Sesamum radiatum]|uniref:Uncharacterized protein n=1 Tax=Sesamum radiatum TaxID=300843 RepID=A0AAW2J133_SESRA
MFEKGPGYSSHVILILFGLFILVKAAGPVAFQVMLALLSVGKIKHNLINSLLNGPLMTGGLPLKLL